MAEYTDDTHTLVVRLVTPAGVAHGELINVSAPTSVNVNDIVPITYYVKNEGGSTGTFAVTASGGTKGYRSSTFNLSAGATTSRMTVNMRAPSSGTSVTFSLRCIRIT